MNRGFTLIELLVVLAVVALLLIGVPRFLVGVPGIRLRSAADDLVATLRQLHDAAIRSQTTTGFVLDPTTLTYRLSTTGITRTLPPVVTRAAFAAVSLRPEERTARILFYADGSASGGTIRLQHGDLSTSVRVDWLTGRVDSRE